MGEESKSIGNNYFDMKDQSPSIVFDKKLYNVSKHFQLQLPKSLGNGKLFSVTGGRHIRRLYTKPSMTCCMPLSQGWIPHEK